MGWISIGRKHVRFVLALLTVALGVSGLQLMSARSASIGPRAARSIVSATAAPSSPSPTAAARTARRAESASADVFTTKTKADGLMPIAGKGMWIWLFDQVERGDARRIVSRAKQLGLSHIYVRSSSSNSGLQFLAHIDRIVPIAHREGIKVLAWDFPTFKNVPGDAQRVITVLDHRTPGGDVVDGIAIDLETPAEGVHLTRRRALQFSRLVSRARPDRFRVLVPPRPSLAMRRFYPYDIIPYYHAVAPMVYWGPRNPVPLVRDSIAYLKRFGRPIAPIGQSYDASADGWEGGRPRGFVLWRFAEEARLLGAVGVSFWSWQHANADQLNGIARIRFPRVLPESALR